MVVARSRIRRQARRERPGGEGPPEASTRTVVGMEAADLKRTEVHLPRLEMWEVFPLQMAPERRAKDKIHLAKGEEYRRRLVLTPTWSLFHRAAIWGLPYALALMMSRRVPPVSLRRVG